MLISKQQRLYFAVIFLSHTSRKLQNVLSLFTQATAFNDTYMMVREPGLEIIKYMKMADYNLPVIRYLLCILVFMYLIVR